MFSAIISMAVISLRHLVSSQLRQKFLSKGMLNLGLTFMKAYASRLNLRDILETECGSSPE